MVFFLATADKCCLSPASETGSDDVSVLHLKAETSWVRGSARKQRKDVTARCSLNNLCGKFHKEIRTFKEFSSFLLSYRWLSSSQMPVDFKNQMAWQVISPGKRSAVRLRGLQPVHGSFLPVENKMAKVKSR